MALALHNDKDETIIQNTVGHLLARRYYHWRHVGLYAQIFLVGENSRTREQMEADVCGLSPITPMDGLHQEQCRTERYGHPTFKRIEEPCFLSAERLGNGQKCDLYSRL